MKEEQNNRDLVLSPNEYSLILDESKGNIVVYVGPHKTSLANTDKPVIFEEKRFKRISLIDSIKLFPLANEGYYIVLENHSKEHKIANPGANNLIDLNYGTKVNINGPITFPLWPGQVADVIQGHHLRSNQYLVARIYNEEAARKNWSSAIIKPQKGIKTEQKEEPPHLVMGQLLIIKGTDTSFYIPPTGIEIVKENNKYVRDAISLENLEYCILLDEDGEKRFVYGPSVVFPKPTETFIEKKEKRKFRAIELNELMGIYIKVVAPYKEGTREIKAGEEFFITGKEQKLYFPRAEHAIVRYGKQMINYAVAIPEGESRYTLDKVTGKVSLVKGPFMYLPDPRKCVIIKRVLNEKEINLWYPENKEALSYNEDLQNTIQKGNIGIPISSDSAHANLCTFQSMKSLDYSNVYAGEGLERKQEYTPPRSITLDTKYEGAPIINVWTGYAVQVINKLGKRKIVVGPNTVMLEYDETLEHIELSTRRPKSEDDLFKTVYLRVQNNKVSDLILAETKDIVTVNIKVAYKVNFEGDSNKWFSVENYVKLLTDNLRSIIRNEVKKHKIEDFHNNASDIIRNIVLGGAKEGKRNGRIFNENGMKIYDVEILNITIGNEQIANLLIDAQHYSVQQTLDATQKEQLLEIIERKEKAKRKISSEETVSYLHEREEEKAKINKDLDVLLTSINKMVKGNEAQLLFDCKKQTHLDTVNKAELKRKDEADKQLLSVEQQQMQQRLEELKGEAIAITDKTKAISPDFIAALQAFADKELAGKMADSMAPLAILGGKSIAEILNNLLKGTTLEGVLKRLKK